MLRWFRYFLPKEERFFELFARHSQTVVQGALALQGMLRGGDETPVFCQRVNQFENDADNITREVLTAITEEVTKLEGRVDDLHDIGLKELFLKHRDANTMDFIVGAEIYDHLEKVADRFDDVANEINSIVIEQV